MVGLARRHAVTELKIRRWRRQRERVGLGGDYCDNTFCTVSKKKQPSKNNCVFLFILGSFQCILPV